MRSIYLQFLLLTVFVEINRKSLTILLRLSFVFHRTIFILYSIKLVENLQFQESFPLEITQPRTALKSLKVSNIVFNNYFLVLLHAHQVTNSCLYLIMSTQSSGDAEEVKVIKEDYNSDISEVNEKNCQDGWRQNEYIRYSRLLLPPCRI